MDSFTLACSAGNVLSFVDNKCYSSCPSGTRPATSGASVSICCNQFSCSFDVLLSLVACPKSHCDTCDSVKCLTCEATYSLSQGSCICPDGTYDDGTICQSNSEDKCLLY